MRSGARNLLILGIVSTVIAVATTGVSLAIYHNNGDIYLDRSRPGFLPDEDEIEQDDKKEEDYTFNTQGKITQEVIDEYLEKMQVEIDAINSFEDPFGEKPLSDENLGI
jgi:hypothetical protein